MCKSVLSEEQKLRAILDKNGICSDCGRHFVHHMDEPFASCECKCMEDTEYSSPFMKLQKKYADLKVKLK